MGEIRIAYAPLLRSFVVYDGKPIDQNRTDYHSIEELVNNLPGDLKHFNPKKIKVVLEDIPSELEEKLRKGLEGIFKRVIYPNENTN